MFKDPEVSIIIPVFGPVDYFHHSLESVFAQTFDDFEIIVVDDNGKGSKYGNLTATIVEEHRARGRDITFVRHEINKNGAAARNTGFLHSSGKYISFLDADDYYHPARLSKTVGILRSADAVVGGVYSGVNFRRNGKSFGSYVNMDAGQFLADTLACKFRIGTGSNIFIRREVFEELEGFDEAFWRHQDFEFLVRFFLKYELASIGEALVTKNNDNFNLPNFKKSLEIKAQYLAKFATLIDDLPASDRQYVMKSNYVWMGELALKEGLRKESAEMYRIAMSYGKMTLRENIRRMLLFCSASVK